MKNSPIHWAIKALKNYGYTIQKAPLHIQSTPWSEVCCFDTSQGLVYLKITPPALWLEANIISLLHEKFQAQVPQIIATNQEAHCFLMVDSGIRLHDIFKEGFKTELLIQAMHDYNTMQIMTVNHVDLFLDMGVPDWRLAQLPTLYRQLIEQDCLLIDDGLTQEEVRKLKGLESKLVSICEQLSRYAIPETLSHCDFHDKNILVNTETNQTTLIDLGEVAITHPFFSFLNCVHRAKENFALTDTQYQYLIETCCKHWLAFEPPTRLFEILSIIQQCWSIHSVLGEYRLMNSVDQKSFQALKRQGRLSGNLRYWLE